MELKKKALQNQNNDLLKSEKSSNKKQKEINRKANQSSNKGVSENKSHHKRDDAKKKMIKYQKYKIQSF